MTTVRVPAVGRIGPVLSGGISRLALPVLFTLFGLIIASWASRLPALRDGIAASHWMMSSILFCGGLGAVASYPISPRLMARYGGRRVTLYAGLLLVASLAGIGVADSWVGLMIAVFGFGMAASVFDVAINSLASMIERSTSQSIMARLHGWFCAGGLLGAGIGSVMASLEMSPAAHFTQLALPMTLVLWRAYAHLEVGRVREPLMVKRLSLPRGPLATLGALGFLGAMSEGSIADWSGIFLKDHFAVGDSFAPLALAAFSLAMLLTRMLGDRMKSIYGARFLVRTGAAVSALGLVGAVLTSSPYLSLLGFAMSGIGLALVFPFVFSAAGKHGPAALAGIATMAYSGSLMGPPVLGAVAHYGGMGSAMTLVALISAVMAYVAHRSVLLDQTEAVDCQSGLPSARARRLR